MEKILKSIEETEFVLTELLDACATYREGLKEKNVEKVASAVSVFDEHTERRTWKLSVKPPIQDEDDLGEIFGREKYLTAVK